MLERRRSNLADVSSVLEGRWWETEINLHWLQLSNKLLWLNKRLKKGGGNAANRGHDTLDKRKFHHSLILPVIWILYYSHPESVRPLVDSRGTTVSTVNINVFLYITSDLKLLIWHGQLVISLITLTWIYCSVLKFHTLEPIWFLYHFLNINFKRIHHLYLDFWWRFKIGRAPWVSCL